MTYANVDNVTLITGTNLVILIHGQVAMTWTKQLKVKGIIVANDAAANDNTQKMALKMAVPAGIKVLIKPVEEAIRVLNYPKASEMRILVLTRTVKDALRIREQVGEIEFLNLGNTGRFDEIDISEKTSLTSTIMLTKAEKECLRKLTELDPGICIQQVPNDEKNMYKMYFFNWNTRRKKYVTGVSCGTGSIYLRWRC